MTGETWADRELREQSLPMWARKEMRALRMRLALVEQQRDRLHEAFVDSNGYEPDLELANETSAVSPSERPL